jgi:DNA mismatch endonuclease (patch repair protein)
LPDHQDKNRRTDNLTPEQRKNTMKRVRSQDTKPEMQVRRIVHAMGYRYRLHRRDLPGRPDLVFAGKRKVIFVHGCFWHGHDCPRGKRRPQTNGGYWVKKLEGNRARDIRNQSALIDNGWGVMVIWECQLSNLEGIRRKIREFLG